MMMTMMTKGVSQQAKRRNLPTLQSHGSAFGLIGEHMMRTMMLPNTPGILESNSDTFQ